MTGFSRGSVTTANFGVTVELRSVNNRYLDMHIRCPESLRSQEPLWRKTLSDALARGKVEMTVRTLTEEADQQIALNRDRLTALGGALTLVMDTVPSASPPNALDLLLTPGVLDADDIDEEAQASAAQQALEEAVNGLKAQRGAEGKELASLVLARVEGMEGLLGELRQHLPVLQQGQQDRLRERIANAGVDPDAKRLEEELVYLSHRSDVEEEMDRLATHLQAVRKSLSGRGPCGRRLDFLMQELNREANTLSSKSMAITTTNIAVEFKVLIEQMREQIQNIE